MRTKTPGQYLADAIAKMVQTTLDGQLRDADHLEQLSYELDVVWDLGFNREPGNKAAQHTLKAVRAVQTACRELARLQHDGLEPEPAHEPEARIYDSAPPDNDEIPF